MNPKTGQRLKADLDALGLHCSRFWCDRGREALVLAARLSAGSESRVPAPFHVAILEVSTQSRLFDRRGSPARTERSGRWK